MATIKQIQDSSGTIHNIIDTKNTAGATNSDSKLFLVGAPSQRDNVQTYSHDTAYVGTDGCLYSGGQKVAIIGGRNEGNLVLSAENAEPRKLIFEHLVNTTNFTSFEIIGNYSGLLCDCTSDGRTERIASLNKGGTLSLAGGMDCGGGVVCTNLVMFNANNKQTIYINGSSGEISAGQITAECLNVSNEDGSPGPISAGDISTRSLSASGAITTTSTITATAFYESSDERLKTFTEDYDINLDNLKNIKTGKFYWNADNTQEINGGVSAQTVEQYFPELVRENDEGFKTVNYDGLAVVAIAAIKKLTDRIEQLEEIVRNK